METFILSPDQKHGKGNPKSKHFRPYFFDAGITGEQEKPGPFTKTFLEDTCIEKIR